MAASNTKKVVDRGFARRPVPVVRSQGPGRQSVGGVIVTDGAANRLNQIVKNNHSKHA